MKLRHMFIVAMAFLLCIAAGAAMAEESDFVIEDGVLTKYIGVASHVVIPDGVTAI